MKGGGAPGAEGALPGAGSEETLRDGRVVTLRPLRAGDAGAIEALWRRLDAAARRRFLDLARLPPDDPGALAFERPGRAAGVVAVAEAGSSVPVVGVARYERTSADAAEFSVFVAAGYRRAGLGTTLLRRLAGVARRAGLRRLASDVPTDDVPVLGLLAELGLAQEERTSGARVHASFAVQETDTYLDAVLADQRAGARVALEPFLRPGSIAVVGASDLRRASAGWSSPTWSEAASKGRCTRSTPATGWSRGWPATRGCRRVPLRRTWCSWPCPHRRWPGWSRRPGGWGSGRRA